MARQQYPLEALRKLRDGRAETQARALARQIGRTSAAAATLLERELVLRQHEQRTAEAVQAERERLAAGQLSGADLRRSLDFEAAARQQAQALALAEAEARRELERARAEEKTVREELARLEADAELARRHETSFHRQNEAGVLRAEEEAALEQWSARPR